MSTLAPLRKDVASIPMLSDSVVRVERFGLDALYALLAPYALKLIQLPAQASLPGSYWGESEAGLIGDEIFVREDTPIHSMLHEAAHFVCMDGARRMQLERDAGGDYDEENAVCYLQIVWADQLAGFGRERMWRDMDAWGYTFRLGSAQRWFEEDARDAFEWLQRYCILDAAGRLTGRRRE